MVGTKPHALIDVLGRGVSLRRNKERAIYDGQPHGVRFKPEGAHNPALQS